jgi:hypothetical protein
VAQVNKLSPIHHFLSLLGQWDYDVPLNTQWSVVIQPDAGNGLFDIIKDYTQIDANNFYIPTFIQNKLLNDKTQPNLDGLGLYFAQSVRLPKESFSPISTGTEGTGGYIKGIVGGDRLDLQAKHLNIDFLETNIDFIDGLIRPWIIAASYKGLINLGTTNSIKSSIYIVEYTRDRVVGVNRPTRKAHKFLGCVPTDISDKNLKYDSEPTEALTNNVTWMFEQYTYELFAHDA